MEIDSNYKDPLSSGTEGGISFNGNQDESTLGNSPQIASSLAEVTKPIDFNEKREIVNLAPEQTKPIDFTPKSEVQLKKEARNRRIEKIIGAVGDGIMSLTNLYFTSKGAPNIGSSYGKNVGNKPVTLTSVISERHKNEDKAYNERYNEWMKEQEKIAKANAERAKEEEKNWRVAFRDGFSIDNANWGDRDFVDQLYDSIIEWNEDPKLLESLDQYRYENAGAIDYNGEYVGPLDKGMDLFKGKSGTYLKRALLETLFQEKEGWTTPENLEHLIDMTKDFEEHWLKIK